LKGPVQRGEASLRFTLKRPGLTGSSLLDSPALSLYNWGDMIQSRAFTWWPWRSESREGAEVRAGT